MDALAPTTAARWDLERVLRSRAGRIALALGAVLALAAFNAGHLHEIFQARHVEIGWNRLFARELAGWSAWAIAGWPLFRLALWLRHRKKSWLLFFAIQIPISLATASGATVFQDELRTWLISPLREDREADAQRDREPGSDIASEDPESSRRGRRSGRGFDRDGIRPRFVFIGRTRDNIAIYWMLIGIGAIVTTFLQSRDRERIAQDLRLRTSRLETELARSQLGSLREQVRPHFIFNALHTVGGLVAQDKGSEATRVLIALGDLLRGSLEYGDRQQISLREELRVTECYLDVERVRFGERLSVKVEVDQDCLDAEVPAMLLQPLLENAVRHGVSPRTEGGSIAVRAWREQDALQLQIRDDGQGFPAELTTSPSVDAGHEAPEGAVDGRRRGIGLANVRERVRLLYGDEQSFSLSNAPEGGAVIDIRIPYRACETGEAASDQRDA